MRPPPRHVASPPTGCGAVIGEGDPAATSVVCPGERPDLLLLGDHAGNAIPSSLCDLGLSAADRARHIAWDIGVRALGERMAALLGATFVHQRFSRLVIDCNRDPRSPEAILALSDGTSVPGNVGLDEAGREGRRRAVHEPYHRRIASEITLRRRRGDVRPLIVALHSFTPTFAAERRPWHVGVLYDRGDTRPSTAMLRLLRENDDLTVGDNQPYHMDATDYTIRRHALANDLPYLELEFRQDLLVDVEGAYHWAARCAGWIRDVLAHPLPLATP
jgi:predicted N-formylglutamate amidohydrolase